MGGIGEERFAYRELGDIRLKNFMNYIGNARVLTKYKSHLIINTILIYLEKEMIKWEN
jgi:hypothetical protein